MAILAALVILPVGVVFILSGLIVNLTQALLFVLVRPLTKNGYRRINKVVTESLWLELIWLFDWWAGIKVELYTDSETYNRLMGKENAIVICNHRSDIDWLVGWVLAQRFGCLGSTVAIMKKEIKYLPVIGWSMWFADYLFLERSWAKDETTLESGFQQLENFPMPFWLALFVEGSRFTEPKLFAAQEFAASRGLPIPRNVLVPRTKTMINAFQRTEASNFLFELRLIRGFVSAVRHTRAFIPAIYDCTFVVPKDQPSPTLLRMFRGTSCSVKLEIKRQKMEELPETADGIAKWCADTFVTKDAILERYRTRDIFSEQEIRAIGRPKISLFVIVFWSGLVVFLIVKFFQWSSLLSSWEGILFSAVFLIIVTVVMEILIRSSESENSTPMKLPTKDPMKEKLLQR